MPDKHRSGTILALPAPVVVLLSGFLLMNLGYFMAVPMLTVYATGTLALPAWQAGLTIGVLTIAHRGLGLPGGMLADRLDRRLLLVVGLLMRAAGFAGFALSDGFPALLMMAVVAGTGAALVGPLVPAALAELTTPAARARVFAARSAATNMAAVLGPLLASWLLRIDIRLTFFACTALHLLLLAAVAKVPGLGSAGSRPGLQEVGQHLTRDRAFLALCLAVSGFWIVQTQMLVAVPLQATRLTSSQTAAGELVSALFSAGAITVILCQMLVPRVIRKVGIRRTLAGGVALCGVAMLVAGVGDSVPGLASAVIVLSVGVSLTLPSHDMVVSGRAPEHLLGSYFGIASLAWAAGGFVGSSGGAWMFQVTDGGSGVWLLLGAVGLASALAMLASPATRSQAPSER